MSLQRLKATQLRNLHDLDLRPAPGITVFQGENASGKTSLLEGIHILSCGKSFRTSQLGHVIRYGGERMVVSGEVGGAESGTITIGVELDRGGPGRIRMRAGGKPLHKASELAALIPVVSVHQDSPRVFTEGPQYRRQFLDWGLFHVEPTFLPVWQRYRRALKQRNALLQRHAAGVEAWDPELIASGGEIDRLRRRYLERFMPYFQHMTDLLRIEDRIEATYLSGWDAEVELGPALRRSLPADRAIGYTRVGPHRADIAFRRGTAQVREDLSRGQIKILVCALHLAQAAAFSEATGRRVLLLVDDLTAELDDLHAGRLLERILAMGLQTFITSAEPRLQELLAGVRHKLFHVEHGVVREVI